MAPELSANWKRLEAKIKAESGTTPTPKRKAEDSPSGRGVRSGLKRQRRQEPQERGPAAARNPVRHKRANGKPKMGAAQSSRVEDNSAAGASPSLALWDDEHEVSPEDLAHAYGLGVKKNSMLTSNPSQPNQGFTPGIELGKYVAIDCEMVGVGEGGHESALARVSIVDFHGEQVYDSYVRPREWVTDWRTNISGVSSKHMATARSFEDVQHQVGELLRGRILVGHDVKHDLEVLQLSHSVPQIRDTAKFSGFKKYGHGPKPALRVLAKEILGVEIQNGPHSSIEDARVTMLLFRRFKPVFDVEVAQKFPMKGRPNTQTKKKRKPKQL